MNAVVLLALAAVFLLTAAYRRREGLLLAAVAVYAVVTVVLVYDAPALVMPAFMLAIGVAILGLARFLAVRQPSLFSTSSCGARGS